MPVIRASCLNPAPWSHNPFMILFRCFFSKFWTDQNRPLIWKLMQSPGNLLCLLFRITKRYALTSTTIQTTIIIGWIVLICSFTNEGPGFDFAVVLPSYPGQYQRVVPSHAHIHPLSERGVRHCTQYLRLPPYRAGHSYSV